MTRRCGPVVARVGPAAVRAASPTGVRRDATRDGNSAERTCKCAKGRREQVVTDQRRTGRHARPSIPKAYSFGFITGAFFLLSWAGQFIFQLIVQRNESEQHGQPFSWSEYLPQFFSSTLENWQSEFLQLVWQAAGLAMFYFWGSS